MKSKQYILTTERLTLREINVEDAPFLYDLMNSSGWLEFIGDRGINTLEDAKNYIIKHHIVNYKLLGYGFYLMEKKEDGTAVGMCGLVHRPELEDVDIGFSILPYFYKKGYGFEAATATMKYAKEVLQLSRIVAITTLKNKNSQRLLEKIGLHFEQMIPFKGEELMLYGKDV